MENIKGILQPLCVSQNIELDDTAYDRLQTYFEFLTEYNTKVNLTAITDLKEVAVKHFLDCLLILKYVDINQGAKIIDVGTGAGFPGVVLKIARPDLRLCLLDSLNKRLVFLNLLLGKLSLDADLIHGRAEDEAKKPGLRDSFDFAFSRAVAKLNILSEYCLPFVKKGGCFVSLKGAEAKEEIKNAASAFSALNGELEESADLVLPVDNSARSIVIIRKTGATPNKFPRHGSKIKSKPL